MHVCKHQNITVMCHWNVLCLWLGWGLWSRVLIGATCIHWLLCWAVVLVGGGFEEQLRNCLSVVGRSFSLSSLGFWLRWWLALQTCFMWSCTMWTAGAWTWGGGSPWSRMPDTYCVGIVSLRAPFCFENLHFLHLSTFLTSLLSDLATSCPPWSSLCKPSFFSPYSRHSQCYPHLRSITWSPPSLIRKPQIRSLTQALLCAVHPPLLFPSLSPLFVFLVLHLRIRLKWWCTYVKQTCISRASSSDM